MTSVYHYTPSIYDDERCFDCICTYFQREALLNSYDEANFLLITIDDLVAFVSREASASTPGPSNFLQTCQPEVVDSL